MKNLVFCLMPLTTFLGCGIFEDDGTVHPDLNLFQLQGNVKMVSYEESKIPEPLIASNMYHILKFDKDGTLLGNQPERNEKGYIETVFANVYGDGNTDYYFEWNEKGQVISKKLRLRNDTAIVIDKYEYFYDGERLDSVAYETRAGSGATSYRFIDYDSWEKDEHGNWTTAKVEETTYWHTSGAEDKRMFYIKRNIEYWEQNSENGFKIKDEDKHRNKIKNRIDNLYKDVNHSEDTDRYLSKNLRELMDKAYYLSDGPDYLECNIWTDSQDPGTVTAKIIDCHFTAEAKATVQIIITYLDSGYNFIKSLNFIFENGDWYIDDIDWSEENSLKEYTKNYINDSTR